MRHSVLARESGTVIQIIDPTTGMYLDVSFQPGQTHHALRVMMHGKQYTAYLRLTPIETAEEHDIVATFRVPSAPSDQPEVRKNAQPHPATVLRPEDRTRAGIEGARANPLEVQHPATRVNPNAPHPATVLKTEDITRAAKEAVRVSDTAPQTRAERAAQEAKRVAAQSEIDRQLQEPVMTDEELGLLRADVDVQRQKNSRLAGGGQMGALEPLVESDVDLHALDEHPMSDEEVASLQADAAALRAHNEGASTSGEAKVEYVDEEVDTPVASPTAPKSGESKKGGKGGKITLR